VGALLAAFAGVAVPTPAVAAPPAPGAPGAASTWSPGDKDGFGTLRTRGSKVWYTLNNGTLSEVFFPRIDTPATRDTQLVVSDGATFADREDLATRQEVRLPDGRSLVCRQVDTARSGRYRITKTYTTDPARSAVLVDVRFESLTGKPYSVYVLHDVGLGLNANDDTGRTAQGGLVASDGELAGAVLASSGFTKTSSGYMDRSDGWSDLRDDFRMDWSNEATARGNVVQLGRTRLTGLGGGQRLTLALGFATAPAAAASTAAAALGRGFASAEAAYSAGWHRYLSSLRPAPASAASWHATYDVSVMVLAAHEDKTFAGGFVAAPGRPWAWANELQHLPVYIAVWSRDLYQIATAMLAAGDRAAADRALSYLWSVQQRPDGSFPRTPGWTASRCSAGCRWTRWRSPSCSPGSSAGPGPPTGSGCAGRRTSWWPTGRRRRRSAGRTSAASRRRPSPRRSPGWCAPPTSRGATARPPRPRATCARPTPGRATWSAGR
jgi:glucoamylase